MFPIYIEIIFLYLSSFLFLSLNKKIFTLKNIYFEKALLISSVINRERQNSSFEKITDKISFFEILKTKPRIATNQSF